MLEELQKEQQVRTMEVRRIYELVTVILGLGFKDRSEENDFLSSSAVLAGLKLYLKSWKKNGS